MLSSKRHPLQIMLNGGLPAAFYEALTLTPGFHCLSPVTNLQRSCQLLVSSILQVPRPFTCTLAAHLHPEAQKYRVQLVPAAGQRQAALELLTCILCCPLAS